MSHAYYLFTTGTKVQGYEKRELEDNWASAQLWIITQVDTNGKYNIRNALSKTWMYLSKPSWPPPTPNLSPMAHS